jgi:hypothetical protein
MSVEHTTRNHWSTLSCLFNIPQLDKESLEYYTISVQHTTRNPWNTWKCLYKVPQGPFPGALLTMSIYSTQGIPGALRYVYRGSPNWFVMLYDFYPTSCVFSIPSLDKGIEIKQRDG